MPHVQPNSEFLDYLFAPRSGESENADPARLPSLQELSKELGISVASLREQLEVAKALGLVDVRPHHGIRRLPYTFFPAMTQSLSCAIRSNPENFFIYAELRNHIEASFWHQAVRRLVEQDHQDLQGLLKQAWEKLNGEPVHIPHSEHRQLHLIIFRRVDNLFVTGILEAYWEAYEAIGFNLYADYDYLRQVWKSHQQMVDAICLGDFDRGYQVLVDHTDLLHHRPLSAT